MLISLSSDPVGAYSVYEKEKEVKSVGQQTLNLGSITYARRARDLLARSGIRALLVRSRENLCGYALRLDAGVAERAKELLKASGMRYS